MFIKFVKQHVCFNRDHAANICICDIGHYRKKAYDNGLCQTIAPRTNRPKPHGFLNLPVVTEWQNLDVTQHYNDIEAAVRFATKRNMIPVSIGGDDGVTNPVIRGTDALDNVTLIQIDAHLDWRDQRFGERDGFSSPMRRASELQHIQAIHQIGIRSVGSAEQAEWDYAQKWGSHIHLARNIHLNGMAPVIKSLPNDGKFFVTLDVDGLDPSVMPGTVALSPGGLAWWHVVTLFEALDKKGSIVGLNLVELAPKNDVNKLSLIGAGRLIMKLLMIQLQQAP